MAAPEPETEPPGQRRPPMPRGRFWLAAIGLALLALASHAPALHADFVRYDDTGYLHTHRHVSSGLSLENLRWALTGVELANWHPLTWASHMLDVELFGLEPRGHHAVNLALHALNAALLFSVLRSLTGAALPSLLVAAVFAVHPANVESVAWVAQRKTLLSTFFLLLAIGAYGRYARGGGRRPYAASLAWFALSLASKPMFVTLPFALLLLDFWPLRRAAIVSDPGGRVGAAALARGWWRLLPEKAPYLVLSAAVCAITLGAQQVAMSSLDQLTASQRLANVTVAYVQYLATFFAPVRLAVFYPLLPERLTPALVLGSAALLGALTLGSVRLGLRRRYLLVGWLWFLGTLVPVVGLVQVGMQSRADRYLYVPFWGLAIALVWSLDELALRRLRSRASRLAAAAAGVGLVALLGVLTHRQAQIWHDAIRLFQHAIDVTEGNWVAHGVLAERYYGEKNYARSIEHSREALKYDRDLAAVRSTYGLSLYELGQPSLALEQFELAAAQEPENPLGYMNLGWLHAERGEYDLALRDLETAAAKISAKTLPYTRKMVYANWASALSKAGELEGARAKYALALEIEPGELALLRDLARIDLQLGDARSALEELRRALELDPSDADATWLLASAAALSGSESAAHFARAQELAPRQAVVAVELARSLARAGRPQDAYQLLGELLALAPAGSADDAQFVASTARTHLGEIRLEQGDVRRAVDELDRALAIWPENGEAGSRLAFLLATSADPALRDPARAVALAERACRENREFGCLSTLSTAYATAGRLPDAVDTARKALELASQARDARAVAALEHQLEVYARMGETPSAAPPH